MRYLIPVWLAAALLGGGCTHCQLKHCTLKQVGTLTDIQCKQITDNLAMLAQNPGALPYFALSSSGGNALTDSASPAGSLTFDPFGLISEAVSLQASRTSQESWGLVPVLNPDKLDLMRCAYQLILAPDPGACGEECLKKLVDFYGPDFDPVKKLPRGWFHVGKCADVPCKACYVGHHGCTYVWVMPHGMDGLTRFTLTILEIAVRAPYVPPTKDVVRIYGPDNKLRETQVRTTEAIKPDEEGARGVMPRAFGAYPFQATDIPIVRPGPEYILQPTPSMVPSFIPRVPR